MVNYEQFTRVNSAKLMPANMTSLPRVTPLLYACARAYMPRIPENPGFVEELWSGLRSASNRRIVKHVERVKPKGQARKA